MKSELEKRIAVLEVDEVTAPARLEGYRVVTRIHWPEDVDQAPYACYDAAGDPVQLCADDIALILARDSTGPPIIHWPEDGVKLVPRRSHTPDGVPVQDRPGVITLRPPKPVLT